MTSQWPTVRPWIAQRHRQAVPSMEQTTAFIVFNSYPKELFRTQSSLFTVAYAWWRLPKRFMCTFFSPWKRYNWPSRRSRTSHFNRQSTCCANENADGSGAGVSSRFLAKFVVSRILYFTTWALNWRDVQFNVALWHLFVKYKFSIFFENSSCPV